ncbi:hypothetical protein [Paenibacillus sp. 1001270B_150601_E10]|uniref:hypothetical protein n=1 Tax=Paenibacillus sp. 1001270B_150601_E10 TaxID=2787079 RepID=UPI001E46CCFA|nr:hypothetical protein [Paenibacillus sp. 1001270B_150601_E10]
MKKLARNVYVKEIGQRKIYRTNKDFTKRLLEIADEVYNPPMPTIDTTDTDVTEAASQIKEWVLLYASTNGER